MNYPRPGDIILSNNNLLPSRGFSNELYKSISNGLAVGVVTEYDENTQELKTCFKPYVSTGNEAPLLITNEKILKCSGSGFHLAYLNEVTKLPLTQTIELTEDTSCSFTIGAKFKRDVNVWALTMKTEDDTYKRFSEQEMVALFESLGDNIFSIQENILSASTPKNEVQKIKRAKHFRQSAKVEIYNSTQERDEFGYVALSAQNYYRPFTTEDDYNNWKAKYVQTEVSTTYQGTYVGF
jgi:hypothetical protein